MKLLFPELIKIFDKDPSISTLELDIIRRGTSIMYLKFDSIEFKDVRSFYNGSLSSMGKQFGVETHKESFPYELYTDLDSMKNAENWPHYSEFKSTLNPFVTDNVEVKLQKAITKMIYELGYTASECIEIFDLLQCCSNVRVENERELPTFQIEDFKQFTLDPITFVESMQTFRRLKTVGEVQSMHDYLLVYNKLDCIVGLKAFTKMNELFFEQFGLSLLNYWSIPAASLQILFKYYDNTLNSPYSFGCLYPEIPSMIRKDGYKGGLATPLNQRHAEANGDCEKYPDYVTRTPNNEKITLLTVKDVTSLYG